MPDTVQAQATDKQTEQKSKVESTHRVIHTISMALGIAGAIGATGVWLVANFYVGDVEIKPDQQVKSLVVKVYDRKGGETSFHLTHFQLMPGSYHLEITLEQGQVQNADVEVRFGDKTEVPIVLAAVQSKQPEAQPAKQPETQPTNGTEASIVKQPEVQADEQAQEQADEVSGKPRKNHWWQFWRK